MSKSRGEPEWREFERLVARIEKALCPAGATVKSPDKLPDKDTGEEREVDATIRYTIGTSPVLIAIECRDRAKGEDVQWIEQLAEKRRSIGASIMLAVSSKGFSKPAIKKAATMGIEIRTLSAVTADELIGWLRMQEITLDLSEWSLASLQVAVYDVNESTTLHSDVLAEFGAKGANAGIFVRNSDEVRMTVSDLLRLYEKTDGSIFPDDLAPDGQSYRRVIQKSVERGAFHVETSAGARDVMVVVIELALKRTRQAVPVSRLSQYASADGPLAQAAEWSVPGGMRLGIFRDARTGRIRFGLGRELPKPPDQ